MEKIRRTVDSGWYMDAVGPWYISSVHTHKFVFIFFAWNTDVRFLRLILDDGIYNSSNTFSNMASYVSYAAQLVWIHFWANSNASFLGSSEGRSDSPDKQKEKTITVSENMKTQTCLTFLQLYK